MKIGRRAAAVFLLAIIPVVVSACGSSSGSDDAPDATGSMESGQSYFVGKSVESLAKSSSGVCQATSKTGDADIGVGLMAVEGSCTGKPTPTDFSTLRMIGLKVEDGKVESATGITGFADVRVNGSDSSLASCSMLSNEVQCGPAGKVLDPWWKGPIQVSTLLEIADPCSTRVLMTAELNNGPDGGKSVAGLVQVPKSCPE